VFQIQKTKKYLKIKRAVISLIVSTFLTNQLVIANIIIDETTFLNDVPHEFLAIAKDFIRSLNSIGNECGVYSADLIDLYKTKSAFYFKRVLKGEMTGEQYNLLMAEEKSKLMSIIINRLNSDDSLGKATSSGLHEEDSSSFSSILQKVVGPHRNIGVWGAAIDPLFKSKK